MTDSENKSAAALPAGQETPRFDVPSTLDTRHSSPTTGNDFRDHLATADKDGRRNWIYPRRPHGRFYQARTYLSGLLLALLFAGPVLRINGKPLLLLNVVQRKFIVLGQIFWPHDMFLFALALLIFITGILIFTAAYGRLWCGWACPQTVLMEMVFRRIEYLIEGDAHQQRALAKAPWSASKLVKKVGKHAIFFALSFLVGNTLLAYIIGTEELSKIVTDNPAKHLHGLGFMVFFTGIFYANFARFREQACTFICPYGRFQSTVLDENSIVVAYDYKRGEKRGPKRREHSTERRKTLGLGDCIDCHQCVAVCPTGIDIRNGTQMECVHCTACIDACDDVMERIQRPTGLIRYASLNGIERAEKLKFTPRLAGYTAVLLALTVLMSFLIFTRSDVQTTLLRAPGALFQRMPDGRLSNLYTVKIINKTFFATAIDLELENVRGDIQIMGNQLIAPPQKLAETSVLITLDPASVKSATTPVKIGVYSSGRKIESVKTSFIGPRKDEQQPK